MSSDYGYINARARGMKSKLLGSDFYREALDATDFRAFSTILSQSPYMRDLEEAQSRRESLSAVDDAVARNVYRTTHSLLSFSDGEPHELIGLMLMRYDLANMKAIARGKHAGRDLEDIRPALFPAGELKPAVLDNAASAPDLVSAAQALALTGSRLAGAFHRAARRYQADNDLYALELALDQAYYRAVFERATDLKAPEAFGRYLRREVDATNLRTALKLRGKGAQHELFVPGGKEITLPLFDAIMSDVDASALQGLTNTSFAAILGTDGLGGAEQVIREVLDAAARRLSADPFGPGIVLNYLRLKEAEAARLRLLARGKFYDVPRAALARELGQGDV